MKYRFSFLLLVFVLLVGMGWFMTGRSHAHSVSQSMLAPLYEHDTTGHFFGDARHKIGGYHVFTNPVYDTADKKAIGSSDGFCTYANDILFQCNWTFILPHGNIIFSGAQSSKQNSTIFTLAGGTGIYYRIKGEVILDLVYTSPTENKFKYTFHLV